MQQVKPYKTISAIFIYLADINSTLDTVAVSKAFMCELWDKDNFCIFKL